MRNQFVKSKGAREVNPLCPSDISPPNPTIESWDENGEFESSDLGETQRWAFSPANGIILEAMVLNFPTMQGRLL
jgi:hypothetical protein